MKKYLTSDTAQPQAQNKLSSQNRICWIVIPIITLVLLILDGLGIYTFTDERLLVMGACLLVVLLPLFQEITIKSISLKKDRTTKK